MNKRNKLYLSLLIFTLVSIFSSCGKEEEQLVEDVNNKQYPENSWIERTMRSKYYWYNEIPEVGSLKFDADAETFFKSLLSTKDGKEGYFYSYIESTTPVTRSIYQTTYSYGFDYTLYKMSNTEFVAHILYVAPDSPASQAGIKRGDWIVTMDGAYITEQNYKTLYGGKSMELQLAVYNPVSDKLDLGKKVQIDTAREIVDNPVYFNKVIDWGGRKVGYLVYNHFSSGKTDNDKSFDKDMLARFKDFKTAGVNEFVLDLRYNNGGSLSCAQLLSTMLAPQSALGKTMCTLEYNDKQRPQNINIALNSSLIADGANLNLQTLYVLVTETSASASELVINSLKPYMNVVIIGMQTEGKNVGSETYTDDAYDWKLHPIVCKLFNSENKSDYEKGFTPDYKLDEATELDQFLEFGNTNELLLNAALRIIDGSYTQATTKSATFFTQNLQKVSGSLDRKATPGVVIDIETGQE